VKHSILLGFGLLFLSSVQPVLAKGVQLHATDALLPGEQIDDRPPHLPSPAAARSALDTLSFGYVDTDGFAIEGETWTFDHGDADPFEGWVTTDVTGQARTYFRRITADIWTNGDTENGNVATNNSVPAPILSDQGSAWIGSFQNEADDLCWSGGLGYGNSWCQELVGPVLEHDGSSTITMGFEYFNDTEPDYDYSYAILRTLPSGSETELARFTDQIGLAANHPLSPPVGASFGGVFSDFQEDSQFQLVFRMTADGFLSDEDGEFITEYGPFAVDNVALANTGPDGDANVTYDFESGLDGWTPSACPGFGSFAGIADISSYVIEDACTCELSGNVLEHHDDNNEHPYGQHTEAQSPPVDVQNDVNGTIGGSGQLEIFADWSQYTDLPRANGVFYRPGWNYYPFVCPATGESQWSGRFGQALFFSVGYSPFCHETRNIATDNAVPPEVEQIRFIYETYASCDAFGIPPEECTETTNFSPVIDNIRIRFTLRPVAPYLGYDPYDWFVDGFSQSLVQDPNVPGNADTQRNRNWGNDTPIILGDSLHVVGPVSSPGFEYDARLWFRVAQKGPGSNAAGYDAWRSRVEQDGGLGTADSATDIESGEFATAKMDSSQIGPNPSSSQFLSYFIEGDSRFDSGAGELSEGNEIIADGVLLPGTQIEYFVTGNYLATPNVFSLLPDTSGGFFSEFEILPRWRDDGGILKYPCLLYVDAYNRGAQYYIESALDALGLDYDRFDKPPGSGGGAAPMRRGNDPRSNNGCTLYQLLGYRTILFNTGTLLGNVWSEDYQMLSDWLTATACEGGLSTRGLIMNGDRIAENIARTGGPLLNSNLGVALLSSKYNEYGPTPDEAFCVRLEAPTVGSFAYGTENSQGAYEYDAWGNGCPNTFGFNLVGPTGSGVGNRSYVNVATGEETLYNQITNDVSADEDNYRTVLDAVSWHHLSERDAGVECVGDSAHIVTAATNEIRSALEWVFGVGMIPSLCQSPCDDFDPTNVPVQSSANQTTRLFQNAPNPFHPYTTLRFSLAADGPVDLAIYDVAGRRVKTLIHSPLKAGSHEVVWDGTNEVNKELPAGVYWSQFQAPGLRSNKKMLLLTR